MSTKGLHDACGATIFGRAAVAAFAKLSPRAQARNFVMFMVYLSALAATALALFNASGVDSQAFGGRSDFTAAIARDPVVHGAFRQLRRGSG